MKLFISALLVLCALAVFFSFRIFSPVELKNGLVRIRVEKGSTEQDVVRYLADRGLIRGEFDFRLLSFLSGESMQEGTYYITRAMSEYDIYRLLVAGPLRREKTITIIEGWTVMQIADYLSREGFGTAEEFLKESKKDWRSSYSFLTSAPVNASLEGYLFPDTYRVFEDSSFQDIISKILSNFDKKFAIQMRQDAKTKGFSVHEVVTLASIIEREVASVRDRAVVSDIFLRRLKKNMALQADSTVNYITGKNMVAASLSDIAIASPYNTYKYRGLPPGPIGNPGLSSLKAVLEPNSNSYWYFLSSPDGRVHYSKTFDEHKLKKQKFL